MKTQELEPHLVTTTIHVVGPIEEDGFHHCQLCQLPIAPASGDNPQYKPGDYVGVTTLPALQKLDPGYQPSSYRIGDNNQDALCDGRPATSFHQASLAKPKPWIKQ